VNKKGKKIRVDLRKNREKTARDKSALSRHLKGGDPLAEDTSQGEAVRAKGELSRKRTIIVGQDEALDAPLLDGTVIADRGQIAEVDDGCQVWGCTVSRMLRTRLIEQRSPIAVGDRVRFRAVHVGGVQSTLVSDDCELPEGVIDEVRPRHSTLVRNYERRVQVIAANVDPVVITVSAAEPPLRPHLIDRYLVSVHQGDMRPIICINKADLDADGFAAATAELYSGLGYRAILTSVPDGRGLDELRDEVKDHTAVFTGHSGVGKSSLLNALDPSLRLKVGTLTDLNRGKHTTTTARLLRWTFGGYVVDTPGLRQFDMSDISSEELEAYFKEFVPLLPGCRYDDCTHIHEESCAIRAAVESGQVSQMRYDSYCKMYEECAEKPRY
jgi:ribosome biogenesis GTPase